MERDDTVEVTGLDPRRVVLGGDDKLRKNRRQGARGIITKMEEKKRGEVMVTVKHQDGTVAQYRRDELSLTPSWWRLVWRQDGEIRFQEFSSRDAALEFTTEELTVDQIDTLVWEGPFFGERLELQSGVAPGRIATDMLEEDEL